MPPGDEANFFDHFMEIYDKGMNLFELKFFSAIKAGNLKYLREVLTSADENEREKLLLLRSPEGITITRPSSGSEVYIRQPTPLIVAVCQWFPEICDFLAGFKVSLNEACTVEDPINSPSTYGGVTALHLASMAGKLHLVQSLCKYGADTNKVTDLGDTAIFECCFEGHQSIVNSLVNTGASINIPNNKNITCLMIAAYADNSEVIKYIVDAGVDLNAIDQEGRNALFYTVAGGRIDTLAYLLDSGIQIKTDVHRVSLLMEAAHHGNKDMISYLTQFHQLIGIDLNAVDDVGRNVLFYLLDDDDIDNLELLLKQNIPIRPMNDGRTLIMAATLKCNMAYVKYFVSNAKNLGISINEHDQRGRNCLFYCITGGDIDLFEYLVSEGVRTEPSSEGVTILMQAVAKYRLDFTCYFLDHANELGLDMNAQDVDGWNSVFYAVASGNVEIFSVLVSAGAESSLTHDGRSILMQAAAKGNLDLMSLILERPQFFRIYINQRDNDGWNALFYTVQGGHIDAFKFLIKKGAKVCVALNGSTLLMEAVDKDQEEFVKYLLESAERLGLQLNHRDKAGNNVLFYAVANGNISIFQVLLNAGVQVTSNDHNRNLVMQAALHGHIELVRHLVNFSESLNIQLEDKDQDGRNTLFYCVEGGRLEVLKYLVQCGVHPEADKHGRTNLMQASRIGRLDMVQYFVENREKLSVDVNDKDINGENSLFYATRANKLQVINYLLEHGAELSCNKYGINIFAQSLHDGNDAVVHAIMYSTHDKKGAVLGRDTNGKSVLHHYVIKGNLEIFKQLCQYYTAEIDSDGEGLSLLMHACIRRTDQHVSIMKHLVEEVKVDINQVDKKGQSALFHAALSSNAIAAAYLLSQKMLVISRDLEGKSPLMVASSGPCSKIVEALLECKKGRELAEETDKYGRNSIHYSAMHGREYPLSVLKTYGCDINGRDNEGLTAIMYAVRGGHHVTLSALLKRAARLDLCDKEGRSALHHCFLKPVPHAKCAKIMIKYGVDINHQDQAGVTPLMIASQACSKVDIGLIKFLLECGADPIIQDNEGKDSFDYCAFDAEYVKALMRDKSGMLAEQMEALNTNKERLMESIDLQSVLRGLLKEAVLTKTLNFEVIKRPANERVAKLLEILTSRGPNAFNILCRVLKETGHPELAYYLLKESYRKDEEIYW